MRPPRPPFAVALVLAVALLGAACGPAADPPSGSPLASPSPPPGTSGVIDHPTGADEVVLRYEEGGGLMVPEWNVTQVPIFTLYGDGTVVFRDPARQRSADESGVLVYEPLRTARLSEEQVQALLTFAVGEGGLGIARERYDHPLIADASTATFTLDADGQSKRVEVYALGLDDRAPDLPMRSRFLALAERLRSFDQGGALPTAEYVPHGWRAGLMEAHGLPLRTHGWPWPHLAPADFAPPPEAEPPLSNLPLRVLTAEEVRAIGLGELKGGLLGYYVEAPDGNVYSLPIRPLLPDERR